MYQQLERPSPLQDFFGHLKDVFRSPKPKFEYKPVFKEPVRIFQEPKKVFKEPVLVQKQKQVFKISKTQAATITYQLVKAAAQAAGVGGKPKGRCRFCNAPVEEIIAALYIIHPIAGLTVEILNDVLPFCPVCGRKPGDDDDVQSASVSLLIADLIPRSRIQRREVFVPPFNYGTNIRPFRVNPRIQPKPKIKIKPIIITVVTLLCASYLLKIPSFIWPSVDVAVKFEKKFNNTCNTCRCGVVKLSGIVETLRESKTTTQNDAEDDVMVDVKIDVNVNTKTMTKEADSDEEKKKKKRKKQYCKTSIYTDHVNTLLTKNGKILYPNCQGEIIVAHRDTITVSCPYRKINVLDITEATITCEENNRYKYNGNEYFASQLTCSSTPIPTEVVSNTCIYGQYQYIQIGFQVGHSFIEHIGICWDDVKKSPIYALSTLTPKLCSKQVGNRINFRTGLHFTSELAQKYTKLSQTATFSSIFGLSTLPSYLQGNLLEIGHLVAKADFVYEVQQKMTFYYINAAPQWSSFNRGNWRLLEANIRTYVINNNVEIEVYTGTYGTLQLKNSIDDMVDLYLHNNPINEIKQIPVPKFFWKVLVTKNYFANKGIAIIGINELQYNSTMVPCTNIIDTVSWLNIPQKKSVRAGYIIACTLDEFIYIPGLADQLPSFPIVTEY